MKSTQIIRTKTISEYYEVMGLPKPEHPLISLVNLDVVERPALVGSMTLQPDFYSISLKRGFSTKFKYGQQTYDFDEGLMFFMSPGQVFTIETEKGATQRPTGYILFVHPDFLWGTALAQKIKRYEYFSYAVHEALHLSEKEEAIIMGMMQSVEQEYRSNIDKFSQDVIIAQIELLLTYSERFYQRQFITRKISSHLILERLEGLLSSYFDDEDLSNKGLPGVQQIADALHVSPGYLSSLLKSLTGKSTQQHIHDKLIEKAKEKISTTNLSVTEIAYELGFEHAQSFSKLFKMKTSFSPLEFRQSFN